MYISDKKIKKAGLFPSGKYDAVIERVTVRQVEDHLGKKHLCWYFDIDILKNDKWHPYLHCMRCDAKDGPEYSNVLKDLREVMNSPLERPNPDDIRRLCVSITIDCMIDVSSAFLKTASMRNIILKIEKTDIDKNLLKKRIPTLSALVLFI